MNKDILKITLNLVVIYAIGGILLAGVYAKTSPIIFKNKKEDKEAALKAMMPVHLKMKVSRDGVEKVLEVLPADEKPARSDEAEGAIGLDAEVDIYKAKMKKLLKRLKKAGATGVEEYSRYRTEKAGDWEPWHKHAELFEASNDDSLAGYIVEAYGKGYSSYPNMYVAVDKDFTVSKIEVLSHGETPGLGDEIMMDWFKDQFRGKDLEHLEVIKGDTEDKIQAITGATISSRAVTNGVRDAIKMLKEKYEGTEEEYTWGGESGLNKASEEGNEH